MSTEGETTEAEISSVREDIQQNFTEFCYRDLSKKLLDSTGWGDEIELATGSEVTAEAHDNRTVLELVQNARDAIRKADSGTANDTRNGSVAVVVGPETLYVANSGEPFHLNDEDVLKRVRRLGQGKEDDESIGEKGVGMRSILALGERFGVHSRIQNGETTEPVSVNFTTAHPWAMLTRHYAEILTDSNHEFRDQIAAELADPSHLEDYADSLNRVIAGLNDSGSAYPALMENDDWPGADTIMDDISNGILPRPNAVIEGLPNLSAFKYPLLRDTTIDDPIVRTLLGEESSRFQADNGLARSLSGDQYTTVVSVEYEDEASTLLYELFAESFSNTEQDLDLPVEEWREAAAREPDSIAQQQIWDECQETISREVLILLGEIETIDLVLLEDTTDLTVGESKRYRCQVGESSVDSHTPDRDLNLQQLAVEFDDRPAEPTPSSVSSEFHLYYKEWNHAETNEDEDNRLRLLFEEPGEDTHWQPVEKPLHLYYPIENETTPFPFILHAPFEVQMDRQNLDRENPKNNALLEEDTLTEFVEETITAIIESESNLRSWLPWIIMPLADESRELNNRNESVTEFVEDLCTGLSNTNCIPTFGGGTASPDHVLIEVAESADNVPIDEAQYRLEAFEALRTYLTRHHQHVNSRLPAQENVKNGTRWLRTVEAEGDLNPSQFRGAVERIGLTKLLDRFPTDDDNGTDADFISVLDSIWGVDASCRDGPPEIALDVDSANARTYFETIIDRLPDEDHGPAKELGECQIPLIPALDYSERQKDTNDHEANTQSNLEADESIGRLVRAMKRHSGSDRDRGRIVFREVSAQTQRQIGPPPEEFEVYLVPYDEVWSVALDRYAEEWGTSKFERDTDIYRRVAAELGGYGDGVITLEPGDTRPLEYLYTGYTQINRHRQDPRADLFVPVPYQGWHYHKKFTDSVDTNGLGNLFESGYLNPVDDNSFLHQLYIKQIELPTKDGDWKPADQIVFGQAWADTFRSVAQGFEEKEEPDDPFSRKRVGNYDTSADFRRWATAIECAEQIRDETTAVLASPDEIRDCFGLSSENDTRENSPDQIEWFWPINFLLHLGVQVGPRIEWAWLNPVDQTASSDRRPRALYLEEVEALSKGDTPETNADDMSITPRAEELVRYADVCRRAHNHPAFVVNHAPNCEEGVLHSYDEWEIEKAATGSGETAIPMWWRFAELPTEPKSDIARSFRNAVLSLWPELSDRLFPTGWICTGAFGSGHQVKSARDSIPGLGVIQLREADIWPTSDSDTGQDREQEDRDCVAAEELVDGWRVSALRQIDHDSIEEMWPSDLEEHNEHLKLENVVPTEDLNSWLAISIPALSPAGAADRLDSMLQRFATDSDNGGRWYGDVRDDAFKLLRRFNPDNLLHKAPDEDTKRHWIRRELYYTETQLMVDDGGRTDTRRIGNQNMADATVFRTSLPGFAEKQLQAGGETFVKLPSTNPGPIADVLADGTDADDPVQFGIDSEIVPTRPTVSGEHIPVYEGEIGEKIRKRVPDLAAAYAIEATEQTQEHVQYIEKQLDRAANNICVINSHDVDGYVRNVSSVKWIKESPSDAEDKYGIALVEDEIDGDLRPYHAVDALVDIVDNEAVKDKFEVVLRAKPGMQRYIDTREEYNLGNIERNELHRLLQFTLPSIASGVSRSLKDRGDSPVSHHFELPDDEEVVKTHHSAVRDFAFELPHDDLVADYIVQLTSGPLDREEAETCLRAAVYLAFERDTNRAVSELVTLLTGRTQNIAAGLVEIADEMEGMDLDDWRVYNAERVRQFLTAVVLTDEFYSQLGPEDEEIDIQETAQTVLAQSTELSPSPLASIGEVFPDSVQGELQVHQSLPVIVFALSEELESPSLDRETYPEHLTNLFSEWCQEKYDDAEGVVPVPLDSWQLCSKLSNRDIADVLPAVTETLQSADQPTKRERTQTRKKKERAFDDGEWATNTDVSIASTESHIGFPEVSSGSSHGSDLTEYTGGDGRDGELFCISKAWAEFNEAGEKQSDILREIREWRNECSGSDQWRLKETSDVFDGEDGLCDRYGDFSFEKLRQRVCDSNEPEDIRRKWFRMLVDTSEENGPGFDYIDPFGTSYGSEFDPTDWNETWMRRTEVKSIGGVPQGSYRVSLTGNEFRMARRSCNMCEGRRYLVRLVFGERREKTFEPNSCRDVDDILTAYSGGADDPGVAETHAWDALRGGKIHLEGTLE